MKRLKRNITLYTWWRATRNGLFWIPVFILYYQSFGLNYTQIMLLPVITGIAQLLLEVPSGVIADLWGRKWTLFLGSLLFTLDFYCLLIAKGMLEITISVILFGAALAFISGSDSALLYDTLKALGRENEYKRLSGRAFALQLTTMAIGSLIGAPLTARYGFHVTIFLVMSISTITGALTLFMQEPPREKENADRKFFTHLKEGLHFAISHKKVRNLVIYFGIVTGIMVIGFRLYQPILIQRSITMAHLGPLYTFWLLLGAIAALKASRIEKRIGEKASLLLIPALLLLNFLLPIMTQELFLTLLILTPSEFAWGYSRPVIEEYVNRHLPSSHRATILSLGGFLMSITIFLFAIPVGKLIDLYGIEAGFVGLGVVTLLVGLTLPTLLKAKSVKDAPT